MVSPVCRSSELSLNSRHCSQKILGSEFPMLIAVKAAAYHRSVSAPDLRENHSLTMADPDVIYLDLIPEDTTNKKKRRCPNLLLSARLKILESQCKNQNSWPSTDLFSPGLEGKRPSLRRIGSASSAVFSLKMHASGSFSTFCSEEERPFVRTPSTKARFFFRFPSEGPEDDFFYQTDYATFTSNEDSEYAPSPMSRKLSLLAASHYACKLKKQIRLDASPYLCGLLGNPTKNFLRCIYKEHGILTLTFALHSLQHSLSDITNKTLCEVERTVIAKECTQAQMALEAEVLQQCHHTLGEVLSKLSSSAPAIDFKNIKTSPVPSSHLLSLLSQFHFSPPLSKTAQSKIACILESLIMNKPAQVALQQSGISHRDGAAICSLAFVLYCYNKNILTSMPPDHARLLGILNTKTQSAIAKTQTLDALFI